MNRIHPTAIVDPAAKLADNIVIEAYAVIDSDVEIGDGSLIEAHARIKNGSRIGSKCTIGCFAVISGEPQDIHFDKNTVSGVEIGDGTVVREHSTIHRATVPNTATTIGTNCFFMSGSHVGHDSIVGDNTIIANYACLAGWVRIESNCFISGGVMVHQRTRVGEGAMLSGNSAVSLDVPPFVNAAGRNDMAGINLIGLARRGVARATISEIKSLYATVFADTSIRKNALKALEEGKATSEEGLKFLKFFEPERHYLHPIGSRKKL